MTETLQQKIDSMFQQRPITHKEVNKALQDFREQIKEFGTECDCPLCNERKRTIRNVLALIGEKSN